MRIELREFKESCLRHSGSCAADDFPVLRELQHQEDVRFVAPVAYELRLQKSGQLVEVDGRIETRVGLTCGRCLQAYEQPLSSDFALTFAPLRAEEAELEEVELDSAELGLIYYRDDCLELQDPLQEQVVMALPIAPLCQEACKGLCPECGCILNQKACSCEKQPFNNKFTALAGIKLDPS